MGCLVYKMSTHLSSSRAHGHIIFPLHLSLHTCMKECAYPPQYKAEAFERVRDLSLNMLQGTTPRSCCICWMPSAHVLDAWGYDILRRPSRSANMNEGALLSVVSRMVKDRCCPVLSEAGRTSSMPPACMQGFRCCQCMVWVALGSYTWRAVKARAHRSLYSALRDPHSAKAVRLLGLAGCCFLACLTPLCGYELGYLLRSNQKLISLSLTACWYVEDV